MSRPTRNDDRRAPPRGLFERPRGSGVWWIRYADEHGRMHREKVGRKSLALKVYQKRKNQVAEGRFFPELIRRRTVLLSKAIDDYLDFAESRLRHFYHYRRYGRYWKEALGGMSLRQILPADIECYVGERRRQVRPRWTPQNRPSVDG